MVSGKLVPLLKKDGGIRPVVVGEVFRRLLSKLCVANVHLSSLQYLQPLQLGVGLKVERKLFSTLLIELFVRKIWRMNRTKSEL